MTTNHQAKYFAYELTKRNASDKLEKLSQSLVNATVDMNPHQVEAALFAFKSPLSRGALLADEVGLGKTIEAGLIISQLWAERRRQMLIVVPTSLRKQWSSELAEKFFTPSRILETRSYNELKRHGDTQPFRLENEVAICSYNFARTKAKDITAVAWDLVVIDEAHRLRNVYRKNNKIARALLDAVEGRPKVLLTATPLQNSLMELYGLVQFIDPHIFGDETSFRALFVNADEAGLDELRTRLRDVCHRTLRRQVKEYVPYTNRIALTQDFTPTAREQQLYEAISEYLRRDELHALPRGQRQLMTMVLRKLLASSSFAIAGTLGTLIHRLEAEQARQDMSQRDLPSNGAAPENLPNSLDTVAADYETLGETREEWTGVNEHDARDITDDEDVSDAADEDDHDDAESLSLADEIADLRKYHDLALSITENEKGRALLVALESGFAKLAELGAQRKAVVFTESRRTQDYLLNLLETNGYADEVVLFNGTITEARSGAIYRAWLARHHDGDQITGSKTADMRAALVEHFRDRASVMIATESGAEGINLQFASLVVNFDLPWNPQRIEQRIGRIHRYGQKHDVVVINFLNRANEADQRVFELLSEKFHLFNGVFGASDEVLGAIESGVDFERRIAEIYQTCRAPAQIKSAFDALQRELNEQITARMDDARRKLLENFDEEVHERLRFNQQKTRVQVGLLEDWLWQLTAHGLRGCADFDNEHLAFTLHAAPDGMSASDIKLGPYRLLTKTSNDGDEEAHHYRLGHPLAQNLIARSKDADAPSCEIAFRLSEREPRIHALENLACKTGWLELTHVALSSLDEEDRLIFSAFTDDGTSLDQNLCERLFKVAASVERGVEIPAAVTVALAQARESRVNALLNEAMQRNNNFFERELEKLEKWAEDRKTGIEFELKELDATIKAAKREARLASDLQTKIELQRKASELERTRNRKRREIFDAHDEIERSKESLIGDVESRLRHEAAPHTLFTIRWRLV